MAFQGKGILGNPKGKVGKLVFRNQYNKCLVQSVPRNLQTTKNLFNNQLPINFNSNTFFDARPGYVYGLPNSITGQHYCFGDTIINPDGYYFSYADGPDIGNMFIGLYPVDLPVIISNAIVRVGGQNRQWNLVVNNVVKANLTQRRFYSRILIYFQGNVIFVWRFRINVGWQLFNSYAISYNGKYRFIINSSIEGSQFSKVGYDVNENLPNFL